MNSFCGMVDQRKAFSRISSRDHCQRSSPSRISDTPRAEFEPAQNPSSGFIEWSCAVVITTKPQRHRWLTRLNKRQKKLKKLVIVGMFTEMKWTRFVPNVILQVLRHLLHWRFTRRELLQVQISIRVFFKGHVPN